MMKKFTFFFAFKIIFNKSGDGKLFRHIRGAVIGAALSIIPLVVVLEISDGMIQGIVRRYIEISSFHLQIRLPSGSSESDEKMVAGRIAEMEGVRNVFSYTQGGGILYSERGRTGITVRGIPDCLYKEDTGFRRFITVESGSFSLSKADSIVVSRETAEKLKVEPGDTIKLLTAKIVPGRKPLLRPAKFTVTGIYTSGYQEMDMLSAFISFDCGVKLFPGISSRVIAVKTDDPYSSGLDKTASAARGMFPGIRVATWEKLNDSLIAALSTTKKFLVFIMLLILGVASINISSSVIIIVISKKKDIAILKSMGASEKDIAALFIMLGFFIGIVSAFIGTSLGILAALNINEVIDLLEAAINFFLHSGSMFISGLETGVKLFESDFYLEKIPAVLDLGKLAAASSLAVLFAAAASWIPAKRAGRIDPVDIFKKH